MEGSIQLTDAERKALLKVYRGGTAGRVVRRAQIVLLLAEGRSYREVRDVTFCGFDLIADCVRRLREGRVGALPGVDEPESEETPAWLVRSVTGC